MITAFDTTSPKDGANRRDSMTANTAKLGRPYQNGHSKKVAVGYRLPAWMVAWLQSRPEPATALIEDALRSRHHLKPPAFPHDQ